MKVWWQPSQWQVFMPPQLAPHLMQVVMLCSSLLLP